MKRLNKITLIIVAVMGIMISGCGSDIKKAPLVSLGYNESVISLGYEVPYNTNDFKTWEAYAKANNEYIANFKKNPPKLISLKGRRDCSKLSAKLKSGEISIEPSQDCPPKNRLDDKGYEFTIKTHYGTFKYDTSNKSTKIRLSSYYRAIK